MIFRSITTQLFHTAKCNVKYSVCLFLLTLIVSCEDHTVFYKYIETPVSGWEKTDMVSFEVPAAKENGEYSAYIELRNTNSYPFTKLILRVEQIHYPSGYTKADTLEVPITDKKGIYSPRGNMFHTHVMKLPKLYINKGDSLSIRVNHCMKRSMLPSVSEIGVRVVKE